MLLDVKLIKSDPMFCMESAAASVATWLNRSHEMMFSRIWGFEFLPDAPEYPGVLGKRIAAGFSEEDMLTMLKIYHGLQVNTYPIEKADTLISAIFSELKKGKPVALSLNDSFLPVLDRNRNIKGFLLIVGYEENESFLYLNLHNSAATVESFPIKLLIDMDDAFKKNSDNYYTFSILYNEHKALNYEDFRYNIRNCKSLNQNPFQAMRCLAESILEKIDYELEKCNAGNLYYIPLLYNIMHLMRARKLLSSTADYIWNISREPVLYNLSMDFLEIGYEWNQVWNMLFKLFYLSKDNYKQRIKAANKIAEIADREESLITKIVQNEYNCDHNNVFINREKFSEVKTSNNVFFLDLKDFVNNKAFAQSELNQDGADFTGQSEFFLSQGLPEDTIIIAAGMKFNLDIGKSKDNILCSNQIISIPPGKYHQIMLLGCSEWGEGYGQLSIIYNNDNIERTILHLPDWSQNGTTKVVRAWKGQIIGLNNCKDERSLFAVNVILNHKEEIKGIQLPNTPNMHIFAISLEKNI